MMKHVFRDRPEDRADNVSASSGPDHESRSTLTEVGQHGPRHSVDSFALRRQGGVVFLDRVEGISNHGQSPLLVEARREAVSR